MISFQKLHNSHVLAKNMSSQGVIKGIVILIYHSKIKVYYTSDNTYSQVNIIRIIMSPQTLASLAHRKVRVPPFGIHVHMPRVIHTLIKKKKRHKSSSRIHHCLQRLFLLFKFVRSKTKGFFCCKNQRACDWHINIIR